MTIPLSRCCCRNAWSSRSNPKYKFENDARHFQPVVRDGKRGGPGFCIHKIQSLTVEKATRGNGGMMKRVPSKSMLH